jgi:hemerythrin-like domain-containing protein
MKITDAFLGEHAVFYAQFNHMEQTIPNSESIEFVKTQCAVLAAALKGHAQLEEDLLFKSLEDHIGNGGPLKVMRAEHEEIESALERMPTLQSLDQARPLLLRVIQVARNHFAKEEQVLYLIAHKTLSSEALIELGNQWAQQRTVRLG